MSPAAIGPVKAMTLALDVGKLARRLDGLLDAPDGTPQIRPEIAAFAEAEGIPY
jgi:phosphotransferase system enzyme I (PtsP)